MYRYIKLILCLILFILAYCCNNVLSSTIVPITPLTQSVDGREPYAQSGSCFFLFNIIVPSTLNKDLFSSCSIVTEPISVGTTCSIRSQVVNQTSFSIDLSFIIAQNSQTYTSLLLYLTKSSGSQSYTLGTKNGDAYPYTCEARPVITGPVYKSYSIPKLRISSNIFYSYQYSYFFELDPILTRQTTEFFCSTDEFNNCQFDYITTNLIVAYVFFPRSHVGTFKPDIEFGFSSIKDYPVPTILNYLDYSSLDSKIHNVIPFNIKPSIGYYFQLSSNSTYKVFPPIELSLIPLDGDASKMNFYLSQKTAAPQPHVILNNAVADFYQPLVDGIPTALTMSLSFYSFGIASLNFNTDSLFRISGSEYNIYAPVKHLAYPFGITSINASRFKIISYPIVHSPYANNVGYYLYIPDQKGKQEVNPANGGAGDGIFPAINNIDIKPLNQTHSVLHIVAFDNLSGVEYIYVDSYSHKFYITQDHLVSSIGTIWEFEMIIPFKKGFYISNIIINDRSGLSQGYNNMKLNFDFKIKREDPNIFSKISSFYFSPLNVDVTTASQDVILYLNLTQTLQERLEENTVFLEIRFNPFMTNPMIQGIYDTSMEMYKFPFSVPVKLMPGELDYSIIINGQAKLPSYFFYKFKDGLSGDIRLGVLNIKNSQTVDMIFPIVTNVGSSYNAPNPSWTITFSDTTGIKKIIVGITSDFDIQGQTFTFDGKGQLTYVATIDYIETYCRPMRYWINYVYTEDSLGNIGESYRYTNSKMHPFFQFDDKILDLVSVTITDCPTPSESNPPTLASVSFKQLSNSSIPNQMVRVLFSLADNTAISGKHLPVCYFSAEGNALLSSVSVESVVNAPYSKDYYCDFTFPLKFGTKAYLSIYGIYDTYYNMVGFGPEYFQAAGYDYNVLINTHTALAIESTSSLELSSAELFIYGNGFSYHEGCVVEVQMDLDNVTITPTLSYGSVLILHNLTPSYQYTINVYSPVSGKRSNLVTLKGPRSTPLTPSPTPTNPPVTNPPLSCNSDCGLPQGYGKCVNGVCVCNALQAGLDCKSIVDTTPITKPDPTKPSVNVTIPGSNTIESPQFTSFVSVIAIQELDPLNNNNIISSHQFNNDKWTIVTEGSSTNDIVSSIQYKYLINNSLNTTITSTVQIFSKASNITFGNQQLYMNPSTIKFTFNITSYPFSKSTNTLQLIMTAALESSDKVACSYKEFVDDQSNSEYLKIQIQDRSLFGRFIKFGIVDGRPDIITNTILDNSYGGKQLSQSTSDQSYIGLNIRYYTQYVLIDPDFSVLIESRSAKDQQNSICTNESSKKLTNGQIAGIVVGSAVFLFIIVFTILYIFTRKSASPIALKLRRIGK